jgi:hypothetical protein
MYPGTWLAEQVGVKAPGIVRQELRPDQVVGRTRDREKNNFLIRPLLRGIVIDWDSA